jgi:glutamine synthetase
MTAEVNELDRNASPPEIRQQLEAAGVEFLFGAYVDAYGVPKSKVVPIAHLEDWVAGSELYTVGALEGMGDLGPNEDECVSIPDLNSLVILPWNPRYALAAADLYFHGEPYSHDSRRMLRAQLQAAAELGFGLNLGVEPEVYVLRDVDGTFRPWIEEDLLNAATRGYDVETTLLAASFLEPMVKYMNNLGWDVYSFDHEGGDGQYEFDFRYTDGLTMADRMLVFRLMTKQVARELGCIATYMPKPWSSAFGSGAHFNMSLCDVETGGNVFENPDSNGGQAVKAGEDRYSKLAYHFTAGVLEHADAITAVVCPTVNSYKRLTPRGLMREMSWAPVYRAYGFNNRTLMCRLPMNRTCLELRTADSACNFYLGAAITLAAGLDGIRRSLDPGEAVNFNTYDFSARELESRGVHRLPTTLGEAVDAFEASSFAKEVFGETFHADFVKQKRHEWEQYSLVVGEWERELYMHLW